jgi:hypothetical protein
MLLAAAAIAIFRTAASSAAVGVQCPQSVDVGVVAGVAPRDCGPLETTLTDDAA